MNTIKVSIIIPIYNVEQYLKQCLDSVVNQTLKEIEIICVNDGSPDNCGQIIDEYAQKDKRIIAVHKKNGGYASAINIGIEKAQGEYIGIVESDDWIAEEMYEKLYTKANKLNSDITKCAFYYVSDSKNMKMHISNWVVSIANQFKTNFTLEECPDLIGHFASIWSAIYKKDLLKDNNIKIDESIRPYEDLPFVAAVYSKAKSISIIPEGLLFYRQDALGSSTNAVKKTILNYITQRQNNREILIKNQKFSKEIMEKYWKVAYVGSKEFFNKPNNIYKHQFYKRMQNLFKLSFSDKCEYLNFKKQEKKDFLRIIKLPYVIYSMINLLWENFSVKNDYSNNNKYKIFKICGKTFRFKIKSPQTLVAVERE